MEGLAGEVGTAATAISPEGKAFIHGEFWNVSSDEPIDGGAPVRVMGVENLKIKVGPVRKSSTF
ncbi:MAG: NfeD family protein [Thermodesulfobacteriota bacterium]